MLMLIFSVHNEKYAMDCQFIERVLPQVTLTRLSQFPPEVLGLLNYHGAALPIVDLAFLLSGKYAKDSLATRVIICKHEHASMGFLAEDVTQAMNFNHSDFIESEKSLKKFPFLGGISTKEEEMITYLKLDQLINFVSKDLFKPNKINPTP